MSRERKEFELQDGDFVKIDGKPYVVKGTAVVVGWDDPATMPRVPVVAGLEANAPHHGARKKKLCNQKKRR